MPLFQTEILLYGTAYVEAEDKDEAWKLIGDHFGTEDQPVCIDLSESLKRHAGSISLSPLIVSYGLKPHGSISHVVGQRAKQAPQFHAELLIHATVYVKASDQAQARKLIAEQYGTNDDPEFHELYGDLYSDANDVFLSAALTSYGMRSGTAIRIMSDAKCS